MSNSSMIWIVEGARRMRRKKRRRVCRWASWASRIGRSRLVRFSSFDCWCGLLLKRRAAKSVNALKLQNLVMQLRKVCNHVRGPRCFGGLVLIASPALALRLACRSGYGCKCRQRGSHQRFWEDAHAQSTGALRPLPRGLAFDRPAQLTELFAQGHKVLIFSQFTSQLDVSRALQAEQENRLTPHSSSKTGPRSSRDGQSLESMGIQSKRSDAIRSRASTRTDLPMRSICSCFQRDPAASVLTWLLRVRSHSAT